MTDCAAAFYMLVLVNGLPYGEICTTSETELPVAAIAANITGQWHPCPRIGTFGDLAACAPELKARRSADVLRITYASGQ